MSALALMEEEDDDSKDLFVVVDNPEKHAATMESYITFRITTKVNHYLILCFITDSRIILKRNL